jgi:chemotaxis protein CheD
MNRIRGLHQHRTVHIVMPGRYRVSDSKALLQTYAGTTLVVCLYDENLGLGGVANFIVPGDMTNHHITDFNSAEFGIAYIEYIIAEIVKFGGDRKNLKAKIFGLSLMRGPNMSRINTNEKFINEYFENEKIEVEGKELKSDSYKEVIFFPERGSIYVRRLTDPALIYDIRRTEQNYIAKENASTKDSTTVVLF